MRIPLTIYGWPQMVVLPTVLLIIMLTCFIVGWGLLPLWALILLETLLFIVLITILSFFRDPFRVSPVDKTILLAPADGKVTDIEVVYGQNVVGRPALRVGIFLSVFNIHINRAPCNVKVEQITYRKGKFKDARNQLAGQLNESNDLTMARLDVPNDKLLLRQISGAIARRIVCQVSPGEELSGGQKFGMLKFGSRTELYVPAHLRCCETNNEGLCEKPVAADREKAAVQYRLKCLVKVGDKVKAGLTPLLRYELQDDPV